MAVVRYTAKRSLQPPVVVNDVVVLDLPMAYAGMTRSRVVNVVRHRSLSGAQAAYYHTGQQAWDIQTKPLLWATGAANLVQFLDSVESGETFEFSPGEFASTPPTGYLAAVIDSQGYTESRHSSADQRLLYSFRILMLPF